MHPRAPCVERLELSDVVTGRDLMASDDLFVPANQAVELVHRLARLGTERFGRGGLVPEVRLDYRCQELLESLRRFGPAREGPLPFVPRQLPNRGYVVEESPRFRHP